jgi:hypothetical protein
LRVYYLRLYLCPKITQQYKMDAKKIQELIAGYGLMDLLEARLQVVVVGGVARSTIYSAFQRGATSARNKVILETAKQIIAQHEASVVEAVLAM